MLVEEMERPFNQSGNRNTILNFSELAGSLWWLIYIYILLYFPIGNIGVLVISFVYCVSHLLWQWSANPRVVPQRTIKGKDHRLVCQSAEGVRWPKNLVKRNRTLFFIHLTSSFHLLLEPPTTPFPLREEWQTMNIHSWLLKKKRSKDVLCCYTQVICKSESLLCQHDQLVMLLLFLFFLFVIITYRSLNNIHYSHCRPRWYENHARALYPLLAGRLIGAPIMFLSLPNICIFNVFSITLSVSHASSWCLKASVLI